MESLNLKSKIYLEAQKANEEARLTARVAALESRGFDAEALRRDPSVRRIKAKIRQADRRLAAIAERERQVEERVRAKAEKTSAVRAPEAQASPPRARKKKEETA